MAAATMLEKAQAHALESLVIPTPHGIASRVLAKTPGGSITLLDFDAEQGLSEHTSPFEAFVHVLSGEFVLTIGGTTVRGPAGSIVRMPANVPHAVEAPQAARMLLVLFRVEA